MKMSPIVIWRKKRREETCSRDRGSNRRFVTERFNKSQMGVVDLFKSKCLVYLNIIRSMNQKFGYIIYACLVNGDPNYVLESECLELK